MTQTITKIDPSRIYDLIQDLRFGEELPEEFGEPWYSLELDGDDNNTTSIKIEMESKDKKVNFDLIFVFYQNGIQHYDYDTEDEALQYINNNPLKEYLAADDLLGGEKTRKIIGFDSEKITESPQDFLKKFGKVVTKYVDWGFGIKCGDDELSLYGNPVGCVNLDSISDYTDFDLDNCASLLKIAGVILPKLKQYKLTFDHLNKSS